ncbi:DNA alkylation repair protein [Agromyces endophyticus]|uniref:DNA alkylation repair protein n=1 Tax=Agromyces sp. H17E-10 TaxID=2932244 RepID=UPI001FCF8518|nr:DNA alkylation repair protein [Agromyces sp. H17E-10]UOQ87687.1 DNA alkylation repair protein [Agromyces sp. H17E-10]
MTDAAARPQTAAGVRAALAAAADPDRVPQLARFFKTGPGGYAEGDRFIGVTVPQTRAVVREFADLPLVESMSLLDSPIHEHRLAALIVMVGQFARASRPRSRDDAARERLYTAYLDAVERGRVDNWDLVDSSAEVLVGEVLFPGAPVDRVEPELIVGLAASPSVWSRRVAVLATFAATKAGDARPTLAVAERLLDDRHDLIQKAVGWMLREAGKRVGVDVLTGFLDVHAARMPRTMLSYATEHLSPEQRAAYRAMR